MDINCCKKPRILNSDYKRYESWKSLEFVIVRNRHCAACGSHDHDGRMYTRAEWDKWISEAA